ncbi:hypothetical protein Q9R46_16090 [Paenibacillus sp. RRE4]|uniref:Uncharacterized protein n=1 Tax=Paenibacillus silvae TaxID=1325358 RepID=A0ABQ1Z1Z6_9BACL|nr:hypothetical protein [Paenibacillus sp. RRE4]MDT0124180.1 hypothetical protein [Paenibacillus sp. RRE4]GGH46311.1 hypothetical protein GCM10008014_08900 [Paenibacillus silvae]
MDEWQAEYMLIAENTERRGEAEADPVKKGRQGAFLKEYWKAGHGGNRATGQYGLLKNVADVIGESQRTTMRRQRMFL